MAKKKTRSFCCFRSRPRLGLEETKRSDSKTLDEEPLAGFNQSADLSTYPRKISVRTSRATALFLDTLPYNAHTTASDGLWAGVPVLTCTGEAFASRVAASLLNALRMPELIVSSVDDYEALAVELATDPLALTELKRKLARHRLTTPLFDGRLFTKHLESGYREAYARYHADLPPEHIFIPAQLPTVAPP